ncbi:tRNA-(ms[2]io[6]A)-hydroxylase [Thiotrichales bacterium 19S3-7]|nr:tRNA-(ms[2]io[6]A)-hydroxylase [Thiotrichales bacterium 19S3-7]MCF6803046.1 tRNA-(ms[2]io[6]A)-hydroxylase [Thiotrichales bacterium 19S3-11]
MKKVSYKQFDDIATFLPCQTPDSWIEAALNNQQIMLIDHANCEKKAASSALSLMYRYQDQSELSLRMSKIAREELVHFEQVVAILNERNITYRYLSSSRYAQALRELVDKNEPQKLVDTLIVGAFIEARSCERFSRIAPYLDEVLEKFYQGLLASERRHFSIYLDFAQTYSDCDICQRIDYFADKEKELILSKDDRFRFHSGIPS